jgi:methylisocitrate lyase
MVAKVRFAVAARQDRNFLIIGRTGGVRNESFAAAVERAKAYHDAGADLVMFFPSTREEWEQAPAAAGVPTVAMAGLDSRAPGEWAEFGYRMVIDPFTGQAVAHDALRQAYQRLKAHGSTGHEFGALMDVYKTLPALAGLDGLYDIERATTEPGT